MNKAQHVVSQLFGLKISHIERERSALVNEHISKVNVARRILSKRLSIMEQDYFNHNDKAEAYLESCEHIMDTPPSALNMPPQQYLCWSELGIRLTMLQDLQRKILHHLEELRDVAA